MAGNALPLVLLAGAAFLLTRNKGGKPSGELPKDQGQGADKPSDEPSDEPVDEPADEATGFRVDWSFNPDAMMPWVETVGDYQAWEQKLDETGPIRDWAGSLEFRDMDEVHAELGVFIEETMGAFGKTLGRTIDRAELDPEAVDAMISGDLAELEKAAIDVFEKVPGLDFIMYFINDTMPLKLAAFFGFADFDAQGAAMNQVANFKSTFQQMGFQVNTQVGYIGQQNPSLESSIKAFLNSTLPLKVDVGSLGPTIQGGLNP